MVAQMDFFSTPPREAIPVQANDEPSGETLGHKLRPYQEQAVSGAIDALKSNRSTLIVMPTGSGKTRVSTELARRRGCDKILFLAHRDELLQQGRARFSNDLGELIGLDQAQNFAGDQRIVVGSVQTVNMDHRLERFNPKRFDLIIIDEAHHATSPSYRKIIDYFAEAKIVGVTATPDRADEKAMGMVFDSVAFLYEIEDAIRDNYLSDVTCTRINIAGLDLSGCKTTAGDLNQGDLDNVMKVEGVLQGVADATIREARERKTLVFTTSVENAHRLAEIMCRHRNGCAKAVDGKTEIIERRAILRGHQDGDYQFLINVGIATEGYDDPSISCVAIARPTKSRALYTQMAGRGLRRLDGKENCIAEGQRVLTDHGLIQIENVTPDMLIWDGSGFFSHDGAILRGEREVIQYAGLEATADHRVWTKEGWKTFGECAIKQIPISVTEHDGFPVRESDGRFRSCIKTEQPGAPSHRMSDVQGEKIKGHRKSEARNCGLSSMREAETSSTVACEPSVSGEAEMREYKGPQVCGLRGERDSVLFSIADSNGGLDNEEPWNKQEHGNRQDKEFRELRAWKSSAVDEETEPSPHQENDAFVEGARVSPIASRDQVCGFDTDTPCCDDDLRRNSGEVQPQIVQTKRRVWDILNAGPFHRFTVEGLLVHNCLLLDFVGNSGRHKLASALDVLGGKYTDEEQELAEKIVAENPGMNARKAMDEAQLRIEEEKRKAIEAARRSAIKAKAIYTKSIVNPFSVFGIDVTKDRQIESRFGGRIASDKQIECLKKFKIPIEEGLTAGMASRLIGAAIGRREKNLASFGQLKALQRHGIDATNMGFKTASAVMDAIAKNNWRTIPHGQLSDILIAHGEHQ